MNQAIGRIELCGIQSIALCCDRHHLRFLTAPSHQAEISNSINFNVFLKVKQVRLEPIYRDHWFDVVAVLPSGYVEIQPYFNCRVVQFHPALKILPTQPRLQRAILHSPS